MVQPPYTESPLPRGDNRRKVTPLILTATTNAETFPIPTEDGVRLWLSELDALSRRAVAIQRCPRFGVDAPAGRPGIVLASRRYALKSGTGTARPVRVISAIRLPSFSSWLCCK